MDERAPRVPNDGAAAGPPVPPEGAPVGADARPAAGSHAIRTDRRQVVGNPLPEIVDEVRLGRDAWLSGELALARSFGSIDRCGAFLFHRAASLWEFAVQLGYDPERVRVLADVGWALDNVEGLEASLRTGEITIPSAAALGTLWRRGARPRSGEDWLRLAREGRLKTVRAFVRRRLAEEAARQEGLVEITVFMTVGQKDTLDQARVIASREARKTLTNDQTVVRALDHYVETKDPLRRDARPRRVGPTSERPGSRYVPVEVVRALHRRSNGACEVPGCPHTIHLAICHLDPHAEGGDRELDNLVCMCTRHHTLLDAGEIRFVGFDAEGRPRFQGGGATPASPPAPPPPGDALPAVDGGVAPVEASGDARRDSTAVRPDGLEEDPRDDPPPPPSGGWPQQAREGAPRLAASRDGAGRRPTRPARAVRSVPARRADRAAQARWKPP